MNAIRKCNKRVVGKSLLALLVLAGLMSATSCNNPMTTSTPTSTIEQPAPTHLGLAYYSEQRDGIENQGALYLLDLASGEERRLTGKGEIITLYSGFSWSPITRKLVYVAGAYEKAEIYTVDVTGQHRQRLTDNNYEDASPLWSPDGQQILFQRRGGEIGDTAQRAYVMNADGSGQRRLMDDPHVIGCGYWSPDGRRIALLAMRGSKLGNVDDFLILDVTSGKTVSHIVDDRPHTAVVWSHDSTKLASITYSFQGDLYQLHVVDIVTGDQTRLSEMGDVLSCDWSPDDQKFAFNAVQDKTFDIYTVRSDGTDLVNLTHRTEFSVKVGGKWSPDGQRIAFSAAESEQDGESGLEIYILEVESGTISRMTHNQFPDAPPRWVVW